MANILLTITGRSSCWRKIQILSLRHMRNCHEQNTQNREVENIHYFFWKKKARNRWKSWINQGCLNLKLGEKMVLVFIGRDRRRKNKMRNFKERSYWVWRRVSYFDSVGDSLTRMVTSQHWRNIVSIHVCVQCAFRSWESRVTAIKDTLNIIVYSRNVNV